jgi:nucleoside-diphosphate-sugar epimerase
VSQQGIAEHFLLDGARTLYGATKLAAELLITEYAAAFGLRTVVDRCGVIAGPWQMGNYLSDCDLLYGHTDWWPTHGPRQILEAIFLWVNEHERALERALDRT